LKTVNFIENTLINLFPLLPLSLLIDAIKELNFPNNYQLSAYKKRNSRDTAKYAADGKEMSISTLMKDYPLTSFRKGKAFKIYIFKPNMKEINRFLNERLPGIDRVIKLFHNKLIYLRRFSLSFGKQEERVRSLKSKKFIL
jgi:hypothetical protein